MNTIIITANPVTPEIIQHCHNALGLQTFKPIQLSPVAYQFNPASNATHSKLNIQTTLAPLAHALKFDFAVLEQPLTTDQFRILAMDMDSTLITIECIDEIASFAGKKAEVSAITEATMRGEIKNFSDSLKHRVALLKGLPEDILHQVFSERLQLSPGANNLLQFARNNHWKTLLVSGGFTFFTEQLKQQLGLDFTHANQLEIINGHLTGQVIGHIVDGEAKKQMLLNVCQQLGVQSQHAIAMGDGANDLPMMQIAGMSIAYKAKPTVQQHTQFQINQGGLDTLTHWFVNTR